MDINVLICDDDIRFVELVSDIVKKEGYTPIQAKNGQQALDIFISREDIDLVILDVMMPVMDGWETLKEIREFSEVPIIMLTALADEHHEVSGFTKGADEYIAKPFSYSVFKARMNTLLRKRKRELSEKKQLGNMVIDQALHQVFIDDKKITLSLKEYTLLIYLFRNKNRVLSRDQILCSVWGYEYDRNNRTIDTHVKTLRAKLGVCGEYIKTIRGIGYVFEVE